MLILSSDEHKALLDEFCKKYQIPEGLTQSEKERRMFGEFFKSHSIPEFFDAKKKSALDLAVGGCKALLRNRHRNPVQ